MNQYIILLSDLSYQTGIIGLAEYAERQAIGEWLSPAGEGQPDPRGNPNVEQRHAEDPEPPSDISESAGNSGDSDDSDMWIKFLALNKWLFTLGDPDCYPSVPHGHLYSKKREWPKLNPYSGRVFSDMHRAEMQELWNNQDFIEHCRKQVL